MFSYILSAADATALKKEERRLDKQKELTCSEAMQYSSVLHVTQLAAEKTKHTTTNMHPSTQRFTQHVATKRTMHNQQNKYKLTTTLLLLLLL
jgi:hypothetical protein